MTSPAAIQQLLATNPVDHYLSCPPEVDPLRPNIKRIRNFSKDTIPVEFDQPVSFGKTVMASLPYYGDYLHKIYLHVTVPPLSIPTGSTYVSWTQSLGYALIDWVEFRINDFVVDRRSGHALDVLSQVGTSADKLTGLNLMVGRVDDILALRWMSSSPTEIIVPFPFFCCGPIATALPLLALSKTNVKIKLQLKPFQEVVTYDGPTPPEPVPMGLCELLVDYLYVPDDLRHVLMSKTYEQDILIEQIQEGIHQFVPGDPGRLSRDFRLKVDYNLPIKELVLYGIQTASIENNDWFNYSDRTTGGPLIQRLQIMINNVARTYDLPEPYYTWIQPYEHHVNDTKGRYILVHSFAENSDILQPSGSFNFSRVDSCVLHLQVRAVADVTIRCLARNYNVLSLRHGSATLKFLN